MRRAATEEADVDEDFLADVEPRPEVPRGLTEPDGAGRILLFRVLPTQGPRETNRRLAGILGLFYAGSPLIDRAAMRDHLRALYGEGVYKVVVQTLVGGVWTFAVCERIAIRGEPPPS